MAYLILKSPKGDKNKLSKLNTSEKNMTGLVYIILKIKLLCNKKFESMIGMKMGFGSQM